MEPTISRPPRSHIHTLFLPLTINFDCVTCCTRLHRPLYPDAVSIVYSCVCSEGMQVFQIPASTLLLVNSLSFTCSP